MRSRTKQSTRHPLVPISKQSAVAYGERVLNGMVYELYFPEEVQGAGVRLFDLVAAANLPDINILP